MECRDAFCDGFKIVTGPYKGSLKLQRLLLDHDIQAKLPQSHPSKNCKFVRLASCEEDIAKTLLNARSAYPALRKEVEDDLEGCASKPVLGQFDVARDFRGTFYAQYEWKQHH